MPNKKGTEGYITKTALDNSLFPHEAQAARNEEAILAGKLGTSLHRAVVREIKTRLGINHAKTSRGRDKDHKDIQGALARSNQLVFASEHSELAGLSLRPRENTTTNKLVAPYVDRFFALDPNPHRIEDERVVEIPIRIDEKGNPLVFQHRVDLLTFLSTFPSKKSSLTVDFKTGRVPSEQQIGYELVLMALLRSVVNYQNNNIGGIIMANYRHTYQTKAGFDSINPTNPKFYQCALIYKDRTITQKDVNLSTKAILEWRAYLFDELSKLTPEPKQEEPQPKLF